MKYLFLCMISPWLTHSVRAQAGDTLLHDPQLSGWHVLVDSLGEVPIDSQRHFVWEDSVLHVLPDAPAGSKQAFAALVSDSLYSTYTLSLEYRWGEKKFAPRNRAKRDAGILFHVQPSEEFWPTSLEYQIQEGDTGDLWLVGTRAVSSRSPDGKQFAPDGLPARLAGKRYVRFARRPVTEQAGWNSVRLEVSGQEARFYLNGALVNTFTEAQWRPADDWEPLVSGKIALQAEGAEVFYRNVVLRRTK